MADYPENCAHCYLDDKAGLFCDRDDLPCTPESAEECARESGETQYDGMREAG